MADDRLSLIADIAASYLRRNSVGVDQIGTVVAAITRALDGAESGAGVAGSGGVGGSQLLEEKRAPAVPIKQSVQRDHLVCLDCGMRMKTLKRHLGTAHELSPTAYRERWALPTDYPITAPAYSERRSKMAKTLGLGRKVIKAKGAGRARKRAP
jgi:predicted transcriptional regulator